MCSIYKTAEREIVVRLQKILNLQAKENKTKGLNPLPRGLILKASHLDLLPELDNEDHRSTLPRQ